MDEKYCKRCDKTLPTSKFTKSANRYDGLQAYCRECMKKYRREHYQANKQPYKDRARARTKAVRQSVRDLKDSTPCADCNKQYRYWVMEFDHLPGEDKVDNINALSSKGVEKQLYAEIEKCELVCANCHRERTAKRLGLT